MGQDRGGKRVLRYQRKLKREREFGYRLSSRSGQSRLKFYRGFTFVKRNGVVIVRLGSTVGEWGPNNVLGGLKRKTQTRVEGF